MHDKHFGRIRLFWMDKAHQKNMKSHPNSKKTIKESKRKKRVDNLETAKDLSKMVGQVVLSFVIIYAMIAAAFYTAMWLATE